MNLDKRSSLLTPENIEACVRRIRKEEGGRNCDDLIKTFQNLMTILDIKILDNNGENDKLQSNVTSGKYGIVIRRKDKKIQTSFLCHPNSDLSDIFIAIRAALLNLDDFSQKFKYSFEEYCKIHDLNKDDPSCKSQYSQAVKSAETLSEMFSDHELASLPTSSTLGDKLQRRILILDDKYEYNKLLELFGTVEYYDKLLSQYGYDVQTQEWNLKDFPITQNDKQMDGIKSDIQLADKAAEEYEDYLEYLAEKSHMDINEIKYCVLGPNSARIKIEIEDITND
jgi:hypothetical protein